MRAVVGCAYSDRSMSIQSATERAPLAAAPTLEVVWQEDATALVFAREADGVRLTAARTLSRMEARFSSSVVCSATRT